MKKLWYQPLDPTSKVKGGGSLFYFPPQLYPNHSCNEITLSCTRKAKSKFTISKGEW